MNAEKAVRIIVKNNDQVGKIIKWYQDNKQTLDAEKFVIPFQSGSIILPGEIISFEAKQYGLIELCLQIKSGKKSFDVGLRSGNRNYIKSQVSSQHESCAAEKND